MDSENLLVCFGGLGSGKLVDREFKIDNGVLRFYGLIMTWKRSGLKMWKELKQGAKAAGVMGHQ